MSNKRQLHVSGLLQLARCGVQFEKRHIEGLRTPTSVSAAIGTAVHKSSEKDLREKIGAGTLLPEEQVKEIARDTLVETWAGVEASPEDEDEGLEFSRDKAIDRSVGLAGFHHGALAPLLNPTHVEREWVLDIDGLPLQLAGKIDVQEGLRSVRDTKTSAKSPSKSLADTSLQLTTYALAIHAHDGKIPESVSLDYLVMTPARKETKLIQLESRRVVSDFNPLLARVAQAQRQIESGVFQPADPNSWICSKKFCPYFGVCRYALRPVSVLNS